MTKRFGELLIYSCWKVISYCCSFVADGLHFSAFWKGTGCLERDRIHDEGIS